MIGNARNKERKIQNLPKRKLEMQSQSKKLSTRTHTRTDVLVALFLLFDGVERAGNAFNVHIFVV